MRAQIIAVVCKDIKKAQGNSQFVYVADSDEQMEDIALLIAKATGGMVHEIDQDVRLIVQH